MADSLNYGYSSAYQESSEGCAEPNANGTREHASFHESKQESKQARKKETRGIDRGSCGSDGREQNDP
jgi:hypothetical protein